MRTTFRWLARRLVAGATVPLLAMALTVPSVWAQDTSSEDTDAETTSTSEDQSKNNSEEQNSPQAKEQKRNQTTTESSDRDASTSASQPGQETRSTTRSDTDSTTDDRRRDRSDDDEATGPSLETRRDTAREAREDAREGIRDARDRTRETIRNRRGEARDTARDARQDFRETARDMRGEATETRRDYRDDWRDTRRDAREQVRDTRQEMRQDRDRRTDLRDDVRDFARDTARDAAEYGRRTAREALDATGDTVDRRRDAGREWDQYGRETERDWRSFARDTVRDTRDFADDDRDRRDFDDTFRDDRDSFRSRDSLRDSPDDFVRDRFRGRDDQRSFARDSLRDMRDDRDFRGSRDRREDFRSDRDRRFTDLRSRDRRETRVSRSQIDNFRAASASARDLGLSLNRTSRGLIVDDIRSGAIARTIGLRPGDRIVAVEDYRITSEDQFVRYLFDEDWRYDRVTVTLIRDGRQVPIYVRPVQLIERLIIVQDDFDPLHTFGVVFDERYDDELVVRHVVPGTVAHRAGLRPGDVIVRFYGRQLSTPQQFVQALTRVDAGQAPIVVERDRTLREFIVSMPHELRTTNQRRRTYRRDFDDDRFDNRGDRQRRDQRGAQIQYGGEIYQDGYGAPSGVITTEPDQPIYGSQYQPAQPVQPPSRVDDRSERPGILPRLFGR